MRKIPVNYILDFCIGCIIPRVASIDFHIGEVTGLFIDDTVDSLSCDLNFVQKTSIILLRLGDLDFGVFMKWNAIFGIDAVVFVSVDS